MALDGTKVHANASRHSALSYDHAGKIKAQLQAEATDQADVPDGLSIPGELARQEKRLAEIAHAEAVIEVRAKERHAREQTEYQAKIAARAATGKSPTAAYRSRQSTERCPRPANATNTNPRIGNIK